MSPHVYADSFYAGYYSFVRQSKEIIGGDIVVSGKRYYHPHGRFVYALFVSPVYFALQMQMLGDLKLRQVGILA